MSKVFFHFFTFVAIFNIWVTPVSAQIGHYFEGDFRFKGDTSFQVKDFVQINDTTYAGVAFVMNVKGSNPSNENVDVATFVVGCDGNFKWMKAHNQNFTGHRKKDLATLKKVTDTTFVMITNAYGWLRQFEGSVLYLIHINGSVIKKLFSEQNSRSSIGMIDIATLDEKYICLYSQGSTATATGPFISLFDSDMNLLWSKIYIGVQTSFFYPNTFNDIQLFPNEILLTTHPELAEFGILSLNYQGEINYYKLMDAFSPYQQIHRYPHLGVSKDKILLAYTDPYTPPERQYSKGNHFSLALLNRKDGSFIKGVRMNFDSIAQPNGEIGNGFNKNFNIKFDQNLNHWKISTLDEVDGVPLKTNPVFLTLDTSLNIIEAIRMGYPRYRDLEGLQLSSSNFYFTDSTFYGPTEYIESASNRGFLNNMGFVFAQRNVKNMTCHPWWDITPYWSIDTITMRIKDGDETVEDGHILTPSPFSEVDLYPIYTTICKDKGSLASTIDIIDTTICILDIENANSSTNDFVKTWRWFWNDSLISKNAITPIPTDQAGTYQLQLIVFDGCFLDTSSKTIHILPVDTMTMDTTICLGDSLFFMDTVITQSGSYQFAKANGNGCEDLTVLNVQESGSITYLDSMACVGQLLMIDGIIIRSDTTLQETLTDTEGCDSLVSTQYIFEDDCDCTISVPNAFTPNNDGINDGFTVQNLCDLEFKSYRCSIFNRWGKLVYQSNDASKKWDGRIDGEPAISEVYLINIQAELANSGEQYHFTQDLTLIR